MTDNACRCGRRRERGYKTCSTCRAYSKKHYELVARAKREARRAQGLCPCGRERESGSACITCAACRKAVALSNARFLRRLQGAP